METSRLMSRRSRLFVALSGIIAAEVAYVSGPSDSGILTSVTVGCVVSLTFTVGYTVSNERVKQTLIDLLSLPP